MSTPALIMQSLQNLESVRKLPNEKRLAVFDLYLDFLGDDVLNTDSPLKLQSDAIGRLNDLRAAKEIILARS